MSENAGDIVAIHPGNRDHLLRMLRDLKRGEGLTPERAGGRILMYTGHLGARTAQASYELLRAHLDSMNQSHEYVQALMNAYGGKDLADELSARRESFAATHRITVSRVKDLEEIGVQELAESLYASSRGDNLSMPETKKVSIEDLLLRLTKAVEDQTAVLREISAKLHR